MDSAGEVIINQFVMLCILNGLVPVRSNYIMKPQTIYSCSKCDAQYTKWTGRCLECGGWGTIKENSEAAVKISRVKNKKPPVPAGKTLNLNTVIGKETTRLKTEVEEFDRVLGGGFAPGSLTLLGGEPGIGKSTLVLQIASQIKNKSLYVSGEESAEQIKLRFDRLE